MPDSAFGSNPSGKKVFVVQTRAFGRSKRVTLDTYPKLTPEAARKNAAAVIARIKKGQPPVPPAPAPIPTVADLAERYQRECVEMHCKPATMSHYRLMLRKHIVPALGERLVADVEHKDILSFHNGLHQMPTVANRAVDILVKMFNLADAWGWRRAGSNPCRGIRRFKVEKHERFLTREELHRLEDLGTLAEVDLRGLAGVELKDRGDLRVSGLEACEEAAHRGVRAGEAVAAYQGTVDGGALDALTPPTRDPLAMRFRQRGDRGLGAHRTQVHGKLAVAGQRHGDVEPARRLGGAAKLRCLAPTHQSGTRNGVVGVAQPHARKYLTIFEHLEPPIGHRHLPLSECAGEGTGEKWWSETSDQQCRGGSIKANIGWRH